MHYAFVCGFFMIAKISITKPAMMSKGAMVILVWLYTSLSLKTVGSGLLPPAIKKKPNASTPPPMSIHLKLSLPNNGVFISCEEVFLGVAVLVVAMFIKMSLQYSVKFKSSQAIQSSYVTNTGINRDRLISF